MKVFHEVGIATGSADTSILKSGLTIVRTEIKHFCN